MALRITHLDGPLAGQVQAFGNERERILIGRVSAEADVRYPDDYTAVSREHVVLVQGPGIYRLDLSTAKPVFVDGEPALQDQELRGTVELQLGGSDGPRLKVEVNPGLLGPATVTREKMADVHDRVRGTRRLAAWVGGAVVVVALAVVGLSFYFQEQSVNLRSFVETESKKQVAGTVDPAVLRQARESVYLVLVADAGGELGQGTAWVVAPDKLATNAHVAEIYNQLQPGQELMVRSPLEPYTTHRVLSIELHPGYTRFQERLAEFEPVVKAIGQMVMDAGLIGGYDVAVMTVDQPEALAPPLALADEATLLALDAGEPVAYIGYPMENLALSNLAAKPTPQSKVGNVTAVTDYFNIRRKDGVNQLVQHDIGATGGASGSPVINGKGQVVAVLSAVNFIFLPGEARIPSGASINFAQRADLVQQLLEGTAVEATLAYEALWNESLQLFADLRSVLPDLILGDLKAWLGTDKDPLVLREESGTIGKFNEDWGYPVTRYGMALPEPGVYAFVVIGEGKENIDFALVENGQVVLYDFEPDWFAYNASDFTKSNVQLVVVGEREGQPFTMKAVYWPHALLSQQ